MLRKQFCLCLAGILFMAGICSPAKAIAVQQNAEPVWAAAPGVQGTTSTLVMEDSNGEEYELQVEDTGDSVITTRVEGDMTTTIEVVYDTGETITTVYQNGTMISQTFDTNDSVRIANQFDKTASAFALPSVHHVVLMYLIFRV